MSFEDLPLEDLFLFKEEAFYIILEDLNLSKRIYNALARLCCSKNKEAPRFMDIVERSYNELCLIRNFGLGSQIELWNKLLEYMVERNWN
ncbi:DNA-directed RNA polymerase subunit alpha C-terminal domain-containing protein [Paenibacillus sp. LjRoot153]|uniref:DNA-directed RNA polymerase subunit alpha C-terminal domain-containing protein n=1 Tax=Paenibacillus sp. LjRoot153 TaxID=3342270 RepID=UPI003F4F5694